MTYTGSKNADGTYRVIHRGQVVAESATGTGKMDFSYIEKPVVHGTETEVSKPHHVEVILPDGRRVMVQIG